MSLRPLARRFVPALALGAGLLWLLTAGHHEEEAPRPPSPEYEPVVGAAQASGAAVPSPAPRGTQAKPALHYASDGRSILPANADDPRPEGPVHPHPHTPVHPHPHTPAHERIYRENNLVGALNLAVDLEDPARIRELVARYRSEFPRDEHVLQEGYAIIADCLEGPSEADRAHARDFWNTQIRSQTRRYVRRHCLEH